eukprot:scaffold2436_cov80-Skeletonema_dohrnii-CCMP3373.AAC.8
MHPSLLPPSLFTVEITNAVISMNVALHGFRSLQDDRVKSFQQIKLFEALDAKLAAIKEAGSSSRK